MLLLDGVSASVKDSDFRELVFYFLDSHWREQKPSWWAAFNRHNMAEEQLSEDPESIGAMTRVSSSAQSSIGANGGIVYGYPEQEFKLKAGDGAVEIRPDQVRENTSILWIDEDRQLVEMGFKSGEIPPDKVIEAVANLDNSSVFIQGPPGTGKTYTGSHIIVELIRRGFRAGVSSNSHKAINNLLKAVEKRAEDTKLKSQAQNQRLILNNKAHECPKATGLSFVPIDHDGCSQKSEEEAELIRNILESLVEQRYQDRDGKEHPLTLQNIMIVAPYNMQVNPQLLSINCNTIEQMELVNTLCRAKGFGG